jgi:hypothetical protein
MPLVFLKKIVTVFQMFKIFKFKRLIFNKRSNFPENRLVFDRFFRP